MLGPLDQMTGGATLLKRLSVPLQGRTKHAAGPDPQKPHHLTAQVSKQGMCSPPCSAVPAACTAHSTMWSNCLS